MAKNVQTDPGSFASGFALGAVVGVVGYLVYGTSRGKDIRAKLQDEFERVQALLYEEGVTDSPEASLMEVIAAVQEQAQAIMDGMPQKKRSYSKKKPKKFSGTKKD